MTKVIGLHGAKGSGKDYFYKVAKEAFPHLDIRKVAYADPIKYEVMHIFGLATEDEYDRFKRTTMTFSLTGGYTWNQTEGRHAVREIGMLMRRYNEKQFTNYVEKQILNAPEAIWCITDLRFYNELISIQSMNGVVVKIHRPQFEYDGHVTETEFPDEVCSTIVDNSGTIEQYEQQVIATFTKILQGEI